MINWAFIAFGAAILEALYFLNEKSGLHKEHAMEFCAAMSLFALLFSVPFWFFADAASLPLMAVFFIFLSALLLSLSLYFISRSLRHISVVFVMPFLSFTPIIVAILATVIYKDSISGLQWAGIVLLSIGSFILLAHKHGHPLEPARHVIRLRQIWLMLLAAAFLALAAIVDVKVLSAAYWGGLAVSISSYMPLLFFFMTVIFVIMMLVFHDGFEGIRRGIVRNHWRLSVSAILLIASKFLAFWVIYNNIGSMHPTVSIALLMAIVSTSTFFASLFSGELLHEDNLAKKIAAAAVIAIGACLLFF